MIYNNIIDTIGNTPIIRLNKLVDNDLAEIYVKVESFNPGGSIKDRVAYSMIEAAEKQNLINKDSTIVEPTSGNTGIGVAMICAAKGYRCIIVMPDSMSVERRKILKLYGAELVLTKGSQGMKGAVDKAKELCKDEGYYMLQQFDNPANPEIHKYTTAKEIINSFDTLDAFVAGVGTGGTITGVGEVLRNHYKNINIIAVEPYDSAVLSGNKPGAHKIQGIGAGFIPKVLNPNIYDEIIKIKNEDAFITSRRMAREEGILCGISCGANVFASLLIAKQLGPGKKVLTILPDSGERYLSSTIFAEE